MLTLLVIQFVNRKLARSGCVYGTCVGTAAALQPRLDSSAFQDQAQLSSSLRGEQEECRAQYCWSRAHHVTGVADGGQREALVALEVAAHLPGRRLPGPPRRHHGQVEHPQPPPRPRHLQVEPMSILL